MLARPQAPPHHMEKQAAPLWKEPEEELQEDRPHQAGVGVVEPVVQGQPLDQLEERAVVKVTRVGRNELVHAVLLRPVSICAPVNPSNQDTETQTDRQDMSKKRGSRNVHIRKMVKLVELVEA